MDNTADLPGYKYYVDAETGERPAVFVTFVNIVEGVGSVDGIAFPVEPDELPLLDARERNYVRQRVTDDMWAYVGSDDARARFERGRALGTAVVDAAYLDLVRDAFPEVEPPDLPLRRLRRIDLSARG